MGAASQGLGLLWRSLQGSPSRRGQRLGSTPDWRSLLIGSLVAAVVGAVCMIYLQGDGLASRSRYHTDLTQSPHWVAYHGNDFAQDDLLVEYSTYNESPVQNAIYWTGTRFVDLVLFSKLTGVALFGLTAALFFALVSSMSGVGVGAAAALFFVFSPRSAYEIAGGFSKAWAIAFVLAAVYVVETRRWWILLGLMPLAALAYPVAAVLVGAIALSGIVLELPRAVPEALRGLKGLAAGSALGLLPLLYKYLTPPARIGEMISTGQMKKMWQAGESRSMTLPLWEELRSFGATPFVLISVVLLLVLLSRRGLVWMRSWSALSIASIVSYYVADLVVPRLYLPDRYVRFSVAALSVLWLAHNWARALEVIQDRRVRWAALGAVAALGVAVSSDTFKPCKGEESQGIWEDKHAYMSVSAAIAAQPGPILVAGHPYDTSEILIQARRPVLVINRMYHAWFKDYRAAITARIEDTFRAVYAKHPDQVNALAAEYGVTHMVVRKDGFTGAKVLEGRVYRDEFDKFISGLTQTPGDFVLNPPPWSSILFENRHFWVVKLPIQ